MGGINPERPRPKKDLQELSQAHSRCLFSIASSFFDTHVHLEDAVIAETKDGAADIKAIEKARMALRRANEVMQPIENDVSENFDRINSVDDWQPQYYKVQMEYLSKLRELLARLEHCLSDSAIDEAAQTGRLQASLWHDERNSELRTTSVELTRLLCEVLSHHVQVVEETNE